MKKTLLTALAVACSLTLFSLMNAPRVAHADAQLIIDHTCTNLMQIPAAWITEIKNSAQLHYGHTSHGEQLTVGLDEIEKTDPFYSIARSYWDLPDESSAFTIYEPDIYDNWEYAASVPDALIAYPSLNFSMYSWCMQLIEYTAEQVQDYLDRMAALEVAYPAVTFIYMTGNAQDTGYDGYNRYLRNMQIRTFCIAHHKILYDFEDLDSWWLNPASRQWEHATYDYNGYVIPVEHPHFHGDEAKHTTYESCEQKGKALWWMMARLSGWDQGNSSTTSITPSTTTTIGGSTTSTSLITTTTSGVSTTSISPGTTTTIGGSTTTSTVPDPSTTTTSMPKWCLINEVYGENSDEVELSRHLRDLVLIRTAEGREIIKLYYLWSPFITELIKQDEEFRQDVKATLDEILYSLHTEEK